MFEKQIEYRESLLEHYKEKEDTIKVLKEILSEQIEILKSKQKDNLYPQMPNLFDWSQERTTDVKQFPHKYMTSEEINKKEVLDSSRCDSSERKTIVMDITLIPAEYKEKTIEETIEFYEKEFDVKIIPIDTSRQNTQGNSNNLPILIVL